MKIKKGDTFASNAYGEVRVTKVVTSTTSKIMFLATKGSAVYRNSDIRAGKIKDYSAPTMYGVGMIISRRLAVKNKMAYKTWSQMIKRGYDTVWKESNPTYKNVTVIPEWHRFPNFLKWYKRQVTEDTFILDKDILSNREVKQYSPRNAYMIPYALNMFYSVNTKAKEDTPLGVHKVKDKFVVRINGFNKHFPTNKSSGGGYVGTFSSIRIATQVYEYYRARIIAIMLNSYNGKISKKLYRLIELKNKRIINRGIRKEQMVKQDPLNKNSKVTP